MNSVKYIRVVIAQVTQGEFAAAAGASQAAVSKWERGLSDPDKAEMAAIMAKYPAVKPEHFFAEMHAPSRS